MKKLTIAIMMLLGSFSMASAELGVSIGVSGNLGLYEAAGSETDGTEVNTAKNEEMAGAMGSVFLEINPSFGMLNRLSLGVDYVPHKIQTGTQTTMRSDHSLAAGGTPASVLKNTVQVDIKDITTVYANINLTDWLYVTGGLMTMDVITNETLATGSAYADTSLDGYTMGVGAHIQNDSGFFSRLSVNYMEMDGVQLSSTTNTDNKVDLKSLEGTSAKFSVGKTF